MNSKKNSDPMVEGGGYNNFIQILSFTVSWINQKLAIEFEIGEQCHNLQSCIQSPRVAGLIPRYTMN